MGADWVSQEVVHGDASLLHNVGAGSSRPGEVVLGGASVATGALERVGQAVASVAAGLNNDVDGDMSAAAWALGPVDQVKSSTGAGASVAAGALDQVGQAVASVAAGLNDVVNGITPVAADNRAGSALYLTDETKAVYDSIGKYVSEAKTWLAIQGAWKW